VSLLTDKIENHLASRDSHRRISCSGRRIEPDRP
jgi:hypothetical protein